MYFSLDIVFFPISGGVYFEALSANFGAFLIKMSLVSSLISFLSSSRFFSKSLVSQSNLIDLDELFEEEGYNVVGINHLGDWGTQFGKLISAYKRWVDEEALEKDAIAELLRIYVKFHDEAEKDPSLVDEGRMYFKRLEDGEPEEHKRTVPSGI